MSQPTINILDVIGTDTTLKRAGYVSGRGVEYEGSCPFCGGKDRFRVQPDQGQWWCRQCSPNEHWLSAADYVMRRENIDYTEAAQRLGIERERAEPDAWDYHDADGNLIYQVVRFVKDKKKSYAQRVPSGSGWSWGLNGTAPLIYHLPDVIAAAQAGETIYIAEGEKCCDALRRLGLVATTNSGGAGKWRDPFAQWLKGAGDVVIFADNDEPGGKHAEMVLRSVKPFVPTARIVTFPELGDKGDVADWLAEGHTLDELLARCVPTVETPPAPRQVDTATGEITEDGEADPNRPTIEVFNMDIPIIVEDAWAAIQDLSTREGMPVLYRRGADVCRIEHGERGVVLGTVEKRRMRGALARACIFQETRTGKKGTFVRIVAPPSPVVDDMLVNIDQGLPPINRVVHVPCLASDGSLLTTGGYHANARAYYDPLPGVVIPPVPLSPTREDMERARSLILDDLLIDFPFVEAADRAHAVALMLLPYVREMVDGATPLHFIEAPIAGSGKGLLIDVLLTVGMGRVPQPMSAPADDAEWGKKITAALMGGPAAIFIDNINHTLDSGTLAAALTTPEYTDRILGVSEMVLTPVRCVWAATGNNPTFSTEIARRCIRIRIDPKIDKPQLRTGFKHEYLRQWVADNHGELIWAAITLARYGLAHGGKFARTLGSYENWSALMGRILDGIEIPSFLGNLAAFYDRADTETAAWRALVEIWWDEHGEKEVQAADLFALAEKNDIDLGLRGKTDRALRTAFGMAIARMEDRVLTLQDPNPTAGSRMIRIEAAGVAHKAKLWKLTDTTANVADTRERLEEKGEPREPREPISTRRTHMDTPAHAQENFQSTEGSLGSLGSPKRERVDIDEVLGDVPATRRDRLVSLLRSINPSQQADARGICERYHIDYEAARQAVEEAI